MTTYNSNQSIKPQETFATDLQDARHLLDTELKYECEIRGLVVKTKDDQIIKLLNQRMKLETEPRLIPYQGRAHIHRLEYKMCKTRIEELERRLESNIEESTETDAQRLLHYYYRLGRLKGSIMTQKEQIRIDRLSSVVERLYPCVQRVWQERVQQEMLSNMIHRLALHKLSKIKMHEMLSCVQQYVLNREWSNLAEQPRFRDRMALMETQLETLIESMLKDQGEPPTLTPNTPTQSVSVTLTTNIRSTVNTSIAPTITTSSIPKTVSSTIGQQSNSTNFKIPSTPIHENVSIAPDRNQENTSILNQSRIYSEDEVIELIKQAHQQTHQQAELEFLEEVKRVQHTIQMMRHENKIMEKQYQDKIAQLEAQGRQKSYHTDYQQVDESHSTNHQSNSNHEDDIYDETDIQIEIQRTDVQHGISQVNSQIVNQNMRWNQTAYYHSNGTGVNENTNRSYFQQRNITYQVDEEQKCVEQQVNDFTKTESEQNNKINIVRPMKLRYSGQYNKARRRKCFPYIKSTMSNSASKFKNLEELTKLVNQTNNQKLNCNTSSCMGKKSDGSKNSNASLSQNRAQTHQ